MLTKAVTLRTMRRSLSLFFLTLLPSLAHAVVVRGRVTSAVGVPVAGARVQLILDQRSVADTLSGADGSYEIRTAYAGRFLLLTAPPAMVTGIAPQVGASFYAGRADLLNLDIALNGSAITPQLSSQQTLTATPLRELAGPVAQIAADQLLTHPTIIPDLRASSGVFVLEQGPVGSSATLFLRGAPPQTILTSIDGVTANPLGSAFPLSRLSTSALGGINPRAAVELTPLANPLLLTGASAGLLTITPPFAESRFPVLIYTGDGGNLGAYRNQAEASWARNRFDLLGAFSRFDIANPNPRAPFHLVTWAADVGYHISAGTSLRFSGRYDRSAAPLANPYQLFLVAPNGRDAGQNLFASATYETRTAGQWHNLLRYGMARTRSQVFNYSTPSAGLPVTLTGADGVAASGTAAFNPLPAREDAATNRDEATYQTDFGLRQILRITGEFRYQDERAADILPNIPTNKISLGRTHLAVAMGFAGQLHRRFFYQGSGFIDHSQLYGFTGAPRLGLTYVPVRPGARKFRGTTLHATASTGTREASLLETASQPAAHELPVSRSFDASIDQNLIGEKLTLRASYFHSQFSHEFEPVALSATASQPLLDQSLALRTQGLETDLRYQPFRRVLLEGGYSYLAALTEQSGAAPVFNPNLPAIPIGGLTALAGQRPFHRPPHSGFLLAEYSGTRLNAALQGAVVSRSDASTNLLQSPLLLLPNHNLSPGFTSLDENVSLVLTRHFTAYTQLSNLSDDQHIAPFGFLSTPFQVRAGLRIRIGGE